MYIKPHIKHRTEKVHEMKVNVTNNKKPKPISSLRQSFPYYVLLIPAFLYFLFFKYIPMWGILLSVKDYKPYLGFAESKWVGGKYFLQFFNSPQFWPLLRNTIVIALNNILFYFPLPIILALMLHEIRNKVIKRSVQSIVYIPHFISWVVVIAMTNNLFGDRGIINTIGISLGGTMQKFMYSEEWFRPIVLLQTIWKECGWGTIIFIAALTGVNPELYEAATIDGAGRFGRLWHVTLPAIKGTIIVMLILRVGRFLDTGFEQIFLMLNVMNRSVGEVFDTYIYDQGVLQGKFSYAVTVFKSVLNFVLVMLTDRLAKRFGEEGIL